jgi:hypothetical protein
VSYAKAGNWMGFMSLSKEEELTLFQTHAPDLQSIICVKVWTVFITDSDSSPYRNHNKFITTEGGTTMLHRIRIILPVFTLLMSLFTLQTAHAATIQLPQTGQTKCYDAAGTEITPCTGTGQDGDKLAGVAWPNPRFTVNMQGDGVTPNGTVTDTLTGLIWLTNANCTETVGGIAKGSGYLTWPNALTWCNNLASGACGLADGSVAGDWRLPNIVELKSLVDLSRSNPALPDNNHFSNVQSSWYWSSSALADYTGFAWDLNTGDGFIRFGEGKASLKYVWPVRGGQ